MDTNMLENKKILYNKGHIQDTHMSTNAHTYAQLAWVQNFTSTRMTDSIYACNCKKALDLKTLYQKIEQ